MSTPTAPANRCASSTTTPASSSTMRICAAKSRRSATNSPTPSTASRADCCSKRGIRTPTWGPPSRPAARSSAPPRATSPRSTSKRLQESLRSVEEYAQAVRPATPPRPSSSVRYRGYTLEQAFTLGADSRRAAWRDAKLCVLLSRRVAAAALDWTIAEAAAGGRRHGPAPRERSARPRPARAGPAGAAVDRARPASCSSSTTGPTSPASSRPTASTSARTTCPSTRRGGSSGRAPSSASARTTSTRSAGPSSTARPTSASGRCSRRRRRRSGRWPDSTSCGAAAAETTLPAFAIGGIDATTIATPSRPGRRGRRWGRRSFPPTTRGRRRGPYGDALGGRS